MKEARARERESPRKRAFADTGEISRNRKTCSFTRPLVYEIVESALNNLA